MIRYLYILQNDHHNTHPQTHVQEGESVPEADSENYPFNGLLPRVQGECALRNIILNLLSIHTHKGRNHHHLGAHPLQAGDEPPEELGPVHRILLWRRTTRPTHQTKLDGGGAEALAKSDLKFTESLRRGDQVHIPSGNPTALWYCEVTRE